MIKTTHTILGAALAASFLLAGCGPESTTTSTKSTSSSASTDSSSGTTQGGPGGGSSEQFEEIQACLKEAGLEDKLPQRGEGNKGEDVGRPSAQPSGQPPSGEAPSGDRKGGPFQDEEVQAALKVCGIDLPEPPNGGNGNAQGS